MNPALSTHDLAIGYSQKGNIHRVADSINISLQPGRLTCLMGPNGIGKSTLIKTLTGVLPPLNGRVTITDRDINSLSQAEKAQSLAIVLTEKPDMGFMTVTDLISLGRFPHTNWRNSFSEIDDSSVLEAINNIGLTELKDTPISELSDGNLQKAIIGRALAQDTDIIVLDEPTIHLDVSNRIIIIKLLRRLSREENKAILLSTHDLDLAMTYTDRLWLFSGGKIIEGLPEDLSLNGAINQVFLTENEDYSTEHNLLDALDIKGDSADILILKQAIVKHGLIKAIDKNATIHLENSQNNLNIEYKQNNYPSIEQFLEDITIQ